MKPYELNNVIATLKLLNFETQLDANKNFVLFKKLEYIRVEAIIRKNVPGILVQIKPNGLNKIEQYKTCRSIVDVLKSISKIQKEHDLIVELHKEIYNVGGRNSSFTTNWI